MHIAANGTRTTTGLRQFGIVLALLIGMAGAAGASDYVHQCRSADGAYVMNDEELRSFDSAKGREVGRAIPYKILGRTVLTKTKGYCIANQAPRGQRRFNHAATTYALQVRFSRNGQQIKTFMLCEMASSGLPAGYDCDREVTTVNWTIGKTPGRTNTPKKSDGPVWLYNGSKMRIVADGARRRIEFKTPNERLAGKGVSRGDVLFEGRREDDRYIGKAYAYEKNCRAKPYSVSGRVQIGERRVVVSGRKPVLNERCGIAFRQDVRLVFERK
ncbi:MAG: hypothetical protein JXQ99_23575 [Hyphomicrobiaceae bacterium]